MSDHNIAAVEKKRERWRRDRRARYERDPEKYKARNRIFQAAEHRLRKYGMTDDQYATMLEAQGGVCAICRQPERVRGRGSDAPRRLSVDHDHATGRIRGLLCHACNTALGHLVEDPALFARAVEYLAGEG